MASTPGTEALENWMRSNGGYLHPDVRILQDDRSGVHMRASSKIAPSTTVASAPHSLALSYLNALVDEEYPVFSKQRHRFKVEAIGFFYLMSQYINRERSFWKPYLDLLPSPDGELMQPLFFEEAEDIAWLHETDVWHTATARKKVYEKYYAEGISVLKQAVVDVEPFTWHLFLWAVTIFASRSFSSRSLRPQSGKYWAAYRTSPQGSRQAVLLDMSRSSAEDLHFPVLFPGLDAANHSHDAKVDWTFDPGRFTIALAKAGESEGVAAGAELFNNYGPKSNGEFLIGYGFCIEDNPHDTVAMTLKSPPPALQDELRHVQAGLFDQQGSWNPQKATFQLKKPILSQQTRSGLAQKPQLFHYLPEALLELLLYIVRFERGLPFQFQEHPAAYLTDLDSSDRRYLPHIARMIVQSLTPKLAKLQSTTPTWQPRTKKQQQASIYRKGQLVILESLVAALKTYTIALIYRPTSSSIPPIPNGPSLMSLESFISILTSTNVLASAFLEGIEANAGTTDLTQLRAAGWEEDIWVLLLSWLLINPSTLPAWLKEGFGEYVPSPDTQQSAPITTDAGEGQAAKAEAEQQAAELLNLVRTAAAACPPGSRWEDERWSGEFIAKTGGAVMRWDSFMVMAPWPHGRGEERSGGEEEPRLFVYFLFT